MSSAAPTAEAAPQGSPPASLAQQLGNVMVSTRRDLEIRRQVARGEPRYVVHDPVAFANHALNAAEYRVLCSLGMRATLAETFDELVSQRVLERGDAEEYYGFVLNLHALGLLVVPGMPVEVTLRRREERRRRRRKSPINWLVSARIPLGNPERWLDRVLPYASWLYTGVGFALWASLLVAAAWVCGGQLGELFGDASSLLQLQNLPVLWLAVVILKALHELGHALALKRYGGAVPDFGIIFVFLTPCAYVDANASWTFRSRWHRIVVALAGMYVETLIAFVFALVWAGTPPGLLHTTAQSVVVLATITTVLININPLIKFDGYYAFSDLLGIYNLQERARENLRQHVEHWLFRMPRPEVDGSWRERLLLWLYAPASLMYRISLAFGVTALMVMTWPLLGLPLGLAFAWLLIVGPVVRTARALWSGERMAAVRLRARIVTVVGMLLVVVAAFMVPVSRSVVAPGVLDPGVKYSVRAPSTCFVEQVLVGDGQLVQNGAELCRLRDPKLEERLVDVESELTSARTHHDATEVSDPNTARMLESRIDSLSRRAVELRATLRALEVRALDSGTVVGATTCRPGSYVREGAELMQVHSEHRFVRVVLDGEQIERVRPVIGTEVEVRWACAPDRPVRALICETRRSASRTRVPVELTVAAGGEILAEETGGRYEAEQSYLHVFLQIDEEPLHEAGTGLTARVRFPARQETVGTWIHRRLLTFFYNWRLS